MRIVGVVVIDSDPLETRFEIAFHRSYEISRVLFEVEALGVFRRDDQPPQKLVSALFPTANRGHYIESLGD